MAWLLFTFSYIAFCFLVYTLMSLKRLDIKIYHARVIVELLFCIAFAVAGFMHLK